MKATVDRDTCIACGICSSTCPDVYEEGDDGIAVVIEDPIPEDLEECAQEGADSCPTDAISIEE